MVLDHVAQATRALIKTAALPGTEVFGESDLHAGNVIAVPDRLKERIGKAKIEDIDDGLQAG